MTGRAFLDTNVLVYAFDRSDSTKWELATQLLRDADLTRYVVSAQVLGEFFVTVTRKLAEPVSPDEAEAAVERLTKLEVIPMTSEPGPARRRTSLHRRDLLLGRSHRRGRSSGWL